MRKVSENIQKQIETYLREASKKRRLKVYNVTLKKGYYVTESDIGTTGLKKSFVENGFEL